MSTTKQFHYFHVFFYFSYLFHSPGFSSPPKLFPSFAIKSLNPYKSRRKATQFMHSGVMMGSGLISIPWSSSYFYTHICNLAQEKKYSLILDQMCWTVIINKCKAHINSQVFGAICSCQVKGWSWTAEPARPLTAHVISRDLMSTQT